jgi:hypothetical protein
MGCCCASNNEIYHQTIDKIFLKANDKLREDIMKGQTPLTICTEDGQCTGDEDRIQKIKMEVKKDTKPLLDYLENNYRRCVNVTKLIRDNSKVRNKDGSLNPYNHLLALFTFDQILPEIEKYKTDETFIKGLGKNKRGMKKTGARKYDLTRMLNLHIENNLVQCESYFLDTINHILDPTSEHKDGGYVETITNQHKGILFFHVMNTIKIYCETINKIGGGQNRFGQQRQGLVKRIIAYFRQMGGGDLKNDNDWSKQAKIIKSCNGITSLLSGKHLLDLRGDQQFMHRESKKGSKDKNKKNNADDLRGDEFKTLRGHLLKFGVDI